MEPAAQEPADFSPRFVIGIDFGAYGTGAACAMFDARKLRDQDMHDAVGDTVKVLSRLQPDQPAAYGKLPSTILYKDNAVAAIGCEAERMFMNLKGPERKVLKWELIKGFKQALHPSAAGSSGPGAGSSGGGPAMVLPDGFPIERVLRDYLREFFRLVLEQIRGMGWHDVEPLANVRWVLTAPAMWGQRALALLMRAAEEAGTPSASSGRLLVIREPEAGAIAHFADHLPPANGAKVVVVDVGYSTGDFTVHKAVERDGHRTALAEAERCRGELMGGADVDAAFTSDLAQLMGGATTLQAYQKDHPEEWLRFFKRWQESKRQLKESPPLPVGRPEAPGPPGAAPLGPPLQQQPAAAAAAAAAGTSSGAVHDVRAAPVELPFQHALRALVDRSDPRVIPHLRDTLRLLGEHQQSLLLPALRVRGYFEPTLQRVQANFKELLKRQGGHCDKVVLVGGFFSCPYVVEELRRGLGGAAGEVCAANGVATAVVRGACLYGLFPEIVRSRRSTHSWGVKLTVPRNHANYKDYVAMPHAEKGKLGNGEPCVWNYFDKFVSAGQEVGQSFHEVREYNLSCCTWTTVDLVLCTSTHPDPVLTAGPGCQEAGALEIVLPDKWSERPDVCGDPTRYKVMVRMELKGAVLHLEAYDMQRPEGTPPAKLQSSVSFATEPCSADWARRHAAAAVAGGAGPSSTGGRQASPRQLRSGSRKKAKAMPAA